MSYEKSKENWTIQKLSPGFLLLLASNIILQESYKDNYDDCCLVYNGYATVNCIPITGLLQCKTKVHLKSDEIIFQFG